MKKLSKYDLINFSNSILEHYGIDKHHESIPELVKAMEGHDKIVVMLFDGMGKNIIEKYFDEDSYLRSNFKMTIDSTFPPTTAAATTGFLSGKYPIETGWTAWDAYFKELNRNVILFTNKDYSTEEDINSNYVRESLKYESIVDLINKKDPNNHALLMQKYPISLDGPKDLAESYKKINDVLRANNKCFIYYYFDSPDAEMHELGIDSEVVKDKCAEVADFIEKVTKNNPDTLFVTFADHGHINTKYYDLSDYPLLLSMLRNKIGGEKRSTQFFVKPEYLAEFKRQFLDIYGKHFDLYSKEEIYQNELYGVGTPHPLFDDMMGDYLAVSKDEYSLVASTEFSKLELLKGHHAGSTKEEKLINLSIFNSK